MMCLKIQNKENLMIYKSFIIDKYKGIDSQPITMPLEIKLQKGKAVALIGINECGKSTILKGICAFDYRNDDKKDIYKHLDVLKNRNKAGASSQTAIISATFALESTDINNLISYFNENNLFIKIMKKESLEEETPSENNINYEEKSEEEKISILQKLFKSFSIKCDISKSDTGDVVRKYSLILIPGQEQNLNTNIDVDKFKSKECELCRLIISWMPNMLYITDLPDFYSENDFSQQGDAKHQECKSLINNLFISGTTNSLTVEKFFELYKKDQSEFNAVKSQVVRYLNTEFSNRWNQFELDNAFGNLDIDIEAYPDSKKITIQVKEKAQAGDSYYFIDERSMGFQWFFKFVMNISFNPLKDKGIIFLIDEPGTYLHETAQARLSKELNSMLHDNYMIFSTHYYSMLNLQEIELNRIYVIERSTESIIATKATDYKGYSDESKKSPILPILNAFRKTVIDYIKQGESKKILIVEGLYDKYAINLFCQSPNWYKVEIFPSVGASQIADNMAEFAYYKKDVLALFDNDEAGIKAYDNPSIKESNKMYLNIKEGFKQDKAKSLVMNDLFDSNELNAISEKLKDEGYETYQNYNTTLRVLYENKNFVDKYKNILTNTIKNFEELESKIFEKLKIKK